MLPEQLSLSPVPEPLAKSTGLLNSPIKAITSGRECSPDLMSSQPPTPGKSLRKRCPNYIQSNFGEYDKESLYVNLPEFKTPAGPQPPTPGKSIFNLNKNRSLQDTLYEIFGTDLESDAED